MLHENQDIFYELRIKKDFLNKIKYNLCEKELINSTVLKFKTS